MTLIDESPADESRVREVLHRATDDLAAPVHRLTEQATVGGRRLRRRRRVAMIAGALGATVLVAVPVAVAIGGSSPTTGPQVATDPSPTPTASAEPTPHLVDNDGWTRMPASRMATAFEGLVPEEMDLTDVLLTNEDRAPDEPEAKMRGYLVAHLLSGGSPAGGVNVVLYPTGQPSSKYGCPGNLVSPDECTDITDADGETIGRRSVTTWGDVVVHEVALLRPNGGMVYVAASNSTDAKWGPGSAVAGPSVPLTLDQLEAIAEDPAWISWEPGGPA